jgi:hypothetical protein
VAETLSRSHQRARSTIGIRTVGASSRINRIVAALLKITNHHPVPGNAEFFLRTGENISQTVELETVSFSFTPSPDQAGE